MNVLTDVEVAALQHLGGGIAPRAIEAAVLAKLAAGVSVEPDYMDWDDYGKAKPMAYTLDALNTAIAAAHEAGRKSVHDSCVDLWKEEVIAAARVAAIHECKKIAHETCHAEDSFFGDGFNTAAFNIEREIDALIGKEST